MADGAAGSGSGGAGDPGDGDREAHDNYVRGENPGQGEPGENPGLDEPSKDPGQGEPSEDPGPGEPRKVSAEGSAVGQGSGERDASSGDGGEVPDGRDLGGAQPDGRVAADSGEQVGAHGAYAVETPEQLLGEVKAVRRRTRVARHAYWFPLVLFGLLTCASIPFYVQRFAPTSGVFGIPGPPFLRSDYLGGFGFLTGRYLSYYWLAAILAGVALTGLWYRRHGDRVGLRTPSRGFVITGLVLVVLALLIPVLAARGGVGPLGFLMPGDLLIRGTFPLVLIGIGLCVLAWAERSVALTVIVAGYLALSLVASLYDIENVVYRLGWNLSPAASGLPNVVLPALVLLLSGAGAWVVQRRQRPLPSGPPAAGPASRTP